MEFDLSELKNYSLESKMLCAQNLSSMIIDSTSVSLEKILETNISPFELDVFVMYSIYYDDGSKIPITNKELISCINKIRQLSSDLIDDDIHKKMAFQVMLLTQNSFQRCLTHQLFKYNFFFNFVNSKINMKALFFRRFNSYFEDFELFCISTYQLMGGYFKNTLMPEVRAKLLKYIFAKKNLMQEFTIDRKSFVDEIDLFYHNDYSKLFFGIRTQVHHPFISDDSYRYFPSPHLLVEACTSCLLGKLTESDPNLREKFGKEVLEEYLYYILKELPSKTYITKEIEYGNGKLSSDVIVGEANVCVMFDTKAKIPSPYLRSFDKKVYDKERNICAHNIIQLYEQINNYLKNEYSLDHSYNKENIFGISVMLEDSFINREDIYNQVFEILEAQNGKLSEHEKKYIQSNILILGLDEIEKYVLRKISLVSYLQNRRDNQKNWYDFFLSSEDVEGELIKPFDDYTKKLINKMASNLKNAYFAR